jgi:hypothetical protein
VRFAVEQWSPEYGNPGEPSLAEPAIEPDLDVEVPAGRWAPITPPPERARPDVLFVDGVRRVDASVWIETDDEGAALGLCATYAAGAVRCNGSAELVAAEVRRGLFTSAPTAARIETRHARYEVATTTGTRPEELWLGIQQRMGELEGLVAAGAAGVGLVLVDGPLSHRRHVPEAVGYVKTQHVQYLPNDQQALLRSLRPGQRTPLFLIGGAWNRFSWYLRLPGGGNQIGPAGLVRAEMSADLSPAAAAAKADLVTATLPRFASSPHKEPRAPQNLYPIAGLERALRRRLGDPALLYRELARSASALSGK